MYVRCNGKRVVIYTNQTLKLLLKYLQWMRMAKQIDLIKVHKMSTSTS